MERTFFFSSLTFRWLVSITPVVGFNEVNFGRSANCTWVATAPAWRLINVRLCVDTVDDKCHLLCFNNPRKLWVKFIKNNHVFEWLENSNFALHDLCLTIYSLNTTNPELNSLDSLLHKWGNNKSERRMKTRTGWWRTWKLVLQWLSLSLHRFTASWTAHVFINSAGRR